METRSRTPRQLFWLLQTMGWLLVIPLSASVVLMVFRDPGTIFVFSVVRQLFGFGLSLGLWLLYRQWPAATFRFGRHWWKIGLACAAAAVLDVILTQFCHDALHLPPVPPMMERGTLFSRLAVYITWSALYFAIRQELEARGTELRLAQAEAANREAELQQLRAQVNPHFLFNALGTIINEAETNPAGVATTTHAVADYLRYSLSHAAHQAPLGDELNAMSSYLHVERAALGPDKIDWRIEASDAARMALVPTALVQPLIENALKYGLRTSPAPLQLRVAARVEAGEIIVAVENSGTWINRAPGEKARDSTGIGLANLRRRLELLHGPAARLEITPTPSSPAEDPAPAGRVRVEIRLPFVAPI